MSLTGLLLHLLNFALPALVVGCLLALAAPVVLKKARPPVGWLTQCALNSTVGLLVLLGGLWFFGHDGKMATYAAMVLACATAQWAAARAWRN